MANFSKPNVPQFGVDVYQNEYLPEGGREVNADRHGHGDRRRHHRQRRSVRRICRRRGRDRTRPW